MADPIIEWKKLGERYHRAVVDETHAALALGQALVDGVRAGHGRVPMAVLARWRDAAERHEAVRAAVEVLIARARRDGRRDRTPALSDFLG